MSENRNATYLTKEYRGREQDLWTPCIYESLLSLQKTKPISALKISTCIDNPDQNGPWYKSREDSLIIDDTVKILFEADPACFLNIIEKTFDKKLSNDVGRYKYVGINKFDIAGIAPDIIVINPLHGVYLLENKPYDSSSFTGNQDSEGDYINFIKWLDCKGIHVEYLIIHSVGIADKSYEEIVKIKSKLEDKYGSILLEDIFKKMADSDFTYPEITDEWHWEDFTSKENAYAE